MIFHLIAYILLFHKLFFYLSQDNQELPFLFHPILGIQNANKKKVYETEEYKQLNEKSLNDLDIDYIKKESKK